jgi:hypothetical protein
MKIYVKVKPSSNKSFVQQVDATHYVVSTTEPPAQGKANVAVIKLLAEHLKLPKRLFSIKRGASSKQKTIEFETNQPLF